MINQLYIDYIKAIENPNRVGWNGKVWTAPRYKGYDKNQRGYGIDIVKNNSAKRLTQNRPGQWLTEEEADKLMKEHLLYVYGAAQKHIEGFDNLSDKRKAALLGMLYRGDSVNKNRHIININEPDDNKFFESINNYYKSKGLNERARNSSNFFSNNNQLTKTNFLIPMKWEQWEPPMKFKSGGQVRNKQEGKMNIRKFLNAGKFYIPDEGYLQYQDFNNLSWANKMKRRLNIAKALYDNGSLAKAGYALFGGYDPENPRLSTGMPEYLPGRVNMSLYKNAKNILKGTQTDEGFVNFVENLSKGRIKPDFITKKGKVSPANYNYVDLKSEAIPKGFVQGNEVTIGQVRLPLEGLTVRNVTNPTEVNYVENAAEKAARADFLKTLPREKQFKEARQIAGSNKNTGSGIVEDWEYPTGILKKYKLGRYKETPVLEKTPSVTKLADNKPSTKTASLKSKDYYREKKEDLSNGVNKIRRRVHLNNKALTTGDMRSAGLGRPRTAAKNNDLRIELEKDPNSYWGRQYAKEKLRIAKGKAGAEKSEKEFLKRYWEYKQKGILNKEQNGGLLEFLKNGSGIHIKKKNRGKYFKSINKYVNV